MPRRCIMRTRSALLPVMTFLATAATAGSLPFAHRGLVDIPTATALEHTQIDVGGCFTTFGYETADSTQENDFSFAGRVDLGLFDRAEIGITWLGAAGLSAQASFLVLREDLTTPGIAIGCQNITGEGDYEFFADSLDSLYRYEENQNFSAYVVFTKNLEYLMQVPVTLDLGYGIGRFRQGEDADSDGISNPIRGLFGALEIHASTDLCFAIEWDGRDANLGASYGIGRNVRVRAAVTELEQLTRGDERDPTDVMQNVKLGLGIDVIFGPFVNRTTLQPYEELRPENDPPLLDELEAIRSDAQSDIQELEDSIP